MDLINKTGKTLLYSSRLRFFYFFINFVDEFIITGLKYFTLNNQIVIERKDYQVINRRGLILQCSVFLQQGVVSQPCVIYLHGNNGSRIEGLSQANQILSQGKLFRDILIFKGFAYVTFDFAGCGISQGEYISLGILESEDVISVISFLKQLNCFSQFFIWGKCMGSFAGLIAALTIPNDITGNFNKEIINYQAFVLDTPYYSISSLLAHGIQKHFSYATFLTKSIISYLSSEFTKVLGTDIFEFNLLKHVQQLSNIPACFAYSKTDQYVSNKIIQALYWAYPGQKTIKHLNSEHFHKRSKDFISEATQFLKGYTTIYNHSRSVPSLFQPPQQQYQMQQQVEQQFKQPIQLQKLSEFYKKQKKMIEVIQGRPISQVSRKPTNVKQQQAPKKFSVSVIQPQQQLQQFLMPNNVQSHRVSSFAYSQSQNQDQHKASCQSFQEVKSVRLSEQPSNQNNQFQPGFIIPFKIQFQQFIINNYNNLGDQKQSDKATPLAYSTTPTVQQIPLPKQNSQTRIKQSQSVHEKKKNMIQHTVKKQSIGGEMDNKTDLITRPIKLNMQNLIQNQISEENQVQQDQKSLKISELLYQNQQNRLSLNFVKNKEIANAELLISKADIYSQPFYLYRKKEESQKQNKLKNNVYISTEQSFNKNMKEEEEKEILINENQKQELNNNLQDQAIDVKSQQSIQEFKQPEETQTTSQVTIEPQITQQPHNHDKPKKHKKKQLKGLHNKILESVRNQVPFEQVASYSQSIYNKPIWNIKKPIPVQNQQQSITPNITQKNIFYPPIRYNPIQNSQIFLQQAYPTTCYVQQLPTQLNYSNQLASQTYRHASPTPINNISLNYMSLNSQLINKLKFK